MTYAIDLSNVGGEVAQNVALTDVLPAGVQFSAWITQSGATHNGNTIRWEAASLPTGSVTTISFLATVTGEAGAGVQNTVQVSAANGDLVQGAAAFTIGGTYPLYLPQIKLRDFGATTSAEGVKTEPAPIETDGSVDTAAYRIGLPLLLR